MAQQKRTYKDSVFTDLFSSDINAKKRFLEIYNALFSTNLQDTTTLENVKLGQPFYSSIINDVAYMVDEFGEKENPVRRRLY